MTSIINNNAEIVGALGLTILHSLWQATLLAILLWSVSRVTRSAQLRYSLAYGTLLLQLLVSILTFSWLFEPASAELAGNSGAIIFADLTVAETGATWWNPAIFLFWVVVFWTVGLAIGTIRLGVSFGRVRRMRSEVQGTVPAAFKATVADLAARIGYDGPLHIRISEHIGGPALVGHLKPLLLFPVAIINQLSTEQAEAVILHELAHLKRKDHWWNLLQCIIEVLFYYHPVVWWIGARIREEREHCCDDLVLRHGPGRLAYAKALLYFENQRATPATAVALTNNPTGLLGRVKRFLHQQNIPYQMKSRLFLLPLLTLIALISTAVYAPEIAEPAPEQPTTEVTAIPALAHTAIETPSSAPAAAPNISPQAISPDTLPEGRHQVSSYRNGKSTKFLVEDRAIKELEIDGKVIPEAEFDQHEAMVERMLGTNKTSRSNVMILRDGDYDGADGAFRYKLHSLDQLDGWQGFDSIGFESIEELKKLKSLENLEFLDLENLENLEYMGEEWEDLGERLGLMGERIGRSFEGIFDTDGNVMRFHWDSEDGEPFLFNTDSLPSGTIFKFRSGDDVIIHSDQMEFDGDSSEEKIREMETMIEKLERRKEAMRREMEQAKELQGEAKENQLEMRDRARAMRDRELTRREVQRERTIKIREHQRARSAEQREVAERLRAEARRERGTDYGNILEQLQSEGLIENSGPLKKLSVDNKTLKINGTKASTEAHQRFLELYQKSTGKSPGEKFAIKVTKS